MISELGPVSEKNAAVAMAAAALFVSCVSCAMTSCVGVEPTPRSATPRPDGLPKATLTRMDGDIELAIGRPCRRTGIETCFDATDEDCNGLVDEGCGLANGPVQIVMAWDVADANVDLRVFDPNGEEVQVAEPTRLGFVKDRDCPGIEDACGRQNTEAVTNMGDAAPRGRTRMLLELRSSALAAPGKVHVRVGGHIGFDSLTGSAVLSPERPTASVEWLR